MRKGPYPLSVHMGLVMSEMARLQDVVQGGDAVAAARVADMLLGIQRYQAFDRDIEKPATEIVWTCGQVRLLRLSGLGRAAADQVNNAGGKVLLLVPSMVNRSGVFNLCNEASMMRYFVQEGLSVYLLDWGESAKDDGQRDLAAVLDERYLPVLRYIAEAEGRAVHVLGYCMGGTLSVAAACLADGAMASCTFLAAPWDFDFPSGQLQKRIQFWAPSALQGVRGQGYLSKDWMQTVFATLDPLHTRDKFARFVHMAEKGAEENIFVAVEDWLNDGVDLPAALARECIEDWFLYNKTGKGEWKIGAEMIVPEHIDIPCLVVASRADRLVDYESSMALYNGLRDVRLCEPDCGHIGMIAGRNAIAKVWQPISSFIDSCQTD